MSWQLYTILSLLCLVFFNLLNRVVAVKSENPRAGSFVFNVYGALLALVLFVVTSAEFSISQFLSLSPFLLLLVVCSIVMYGGYERLQYSVKKNINASTTAILFRMSTMFSFVLAIVFLRESITLVKVLGVCCILFANIFLSWKNVNLKIDRFFWLAILCNVFLAVAWTLDKRLSGAVNTTFYSLLIWAGPLPLIFFPKLPLADIKKEIELGSWKTGLMALLNVAGFFFQIKAMTLAEGSRVIPIISSSSILVVLLGTWLLKEREHPWKKLIAGVAATIGVILLV